MNKKNKKYPLEERSMLSQQKTPLSTPKENSSEQKEPSKQSNLQSPKK